jgi:hypothetical protein
MAEQIWGTGYGAKRHLVAEGTRIYGTRRDWSQPKAQAGCSSEIYLSFFADVEDERDSVMAKQACTKCAKQALLKTCPTCQGAGTVSA